MAGQRCQSMPIVWPLAHSISCMPTAWPSAHFFYFCIFISLKYFNVFIYWLLSSIYTMCMDSYLSEKLRKCYRMRVHIIACFWIGWSHIKDVYCLSKHPTAPIYIYCCHMIALEGDCYPLSLLYVKIITRLARVVYPFNFPRNDGWPVKFLLNFVWVGYRDKEKHIGDQDSPLDPSCESPPPKSTKLSKVLSHVCE
jgi:hypothetical protein